MKWSDRMLLKNARYLDDSYKIANGDLIIEDGVIKRLGENERVVDKEIIDCQDYLIIPGLFNSHFHGYSLLAKGLPREMKIENWANDSDQGKVQQLFFESLDKLSSEEYEWVCMKTYAEMVKKGITFVSENEPAYWPDVVAGAIDKIGIRGIVDTHKDIEKFYQKSVGKVTFGTHLLEEEDITNELLEECVKNKHQYDTTFLTHCMENDWRRDLIYGNFNKSSIELYKEKAILDDKTILFHGVYMNEKDIKLVAEAQASVVHCPNSNLWSGAGIAPVSEMLENGVNVCLGTDFASVDIWETMRTAYYLLKVNAQVDKFKAEEIFKMATENGAKAYLEKNLGVIKDGNKADLVFIKLDPLVPMVDTEQFSNAVHNLLFETNEDGIRHVMVEGEWVMFDRNLQTVDEEIINSNYKRILEKVYSFE
jgi:5-methylthioadenosine/S-adenosylhomocysteine deaminase